MVNRDSFGSIYIETKCSNNCIFCDGRGQDLCTLDDITSKTIILLKQGVSELDIVGTEATRLKEFVKYITLVNKKFKKLTIRDPGLSYSDYSFVSNFSGINNLYFQIPLYGSSSKIHDSITRNPGSFVKTIQGIKNLSNLGFLNRISIHSLFLKQNKNDFLNIVKLVKTEFGISLNSISVPEIILESQDLSKYALHFNELREIIFSLDSNIDTYLNLSNFPICIFTNEEYDNFKLLHIHNFFKKEKLRNGAEGIQKSLIKLVKCDSCKHYNKICWGVVTKYYFYEKMIKDSFLFSKLF